MVGIENILLSATRYHFQTFPTILPAPNETPHRPRTPALLQNYVEVKIKHEGYAAPTWRNCHPAVQAAIHEDGRENSQPGPAS